jgi:hypothetical protein
MDVKMDFVFRRFMALILLFCAVRDAEIIDIPFFNVGAQSKCFTCFALVATVLQGEGEADKACFAPTT